ncbi:hypothetical protein HRbin19_01650 [bacterium HR19]|nr:hypothetical protein HRbin19_01650 [bacterium HR19]
MNFVKSISKSAKLIVISIFIFSNFFPKRVAYGDDKSGDEEIKYLIFFGGFPDIRHQGAGIVHPHSESNPASLELIKKYDVNFSFGFGKYKIAELRATDSITTRLSGGIGFKCFFERTLCGSESAKIISADLSYGFDIQNIRTGVGTFIKFKWNDQFEEELGKKDVFFGVGGVASYEMEKVGFTGGVVSLTSPNSLKEKIPARGGVGLAIFTEDIFIFSQVFYLKKLNLSAGATAKALKWFRVSLSYSQKPILGVGFVSPRLYLWGGYYFGNLTLISIGIIF